MEVITISPSYKIIQRISYFLSGIYSSKLNPIYHLGAITVFLLVIDVISGIYLFLFYEVDPKEAYQSVESISSTFTGNIMRGLHRYSSDGLILFAILHMIHMILTDRFRMFRWVAWVSGVGTLLIFLAIGISGYLLVWDERAQLTGLLTAKFFTEIHIFGHALMSAFLGTDVKNLGGLFRILLFGHIAVTILLVFTLWIHVMRISRPRLFPPKPIMILITIYLVGISITMPAKSDPPADLGKIPFGMSMEWFYLTGYPLMKVLPVSVNWLIFVGFFGLLAIFPWLIKGRRNPPAHIVEDRCEGCEQCFIDCPYEAIYMKRLDEKTKKAVVIENKCSGCGICIASCNYNASEIPTINYDSILQNIEERKPEVLVFRCPFSATVEQNPKLETVLVPCTGAVNAVWMRELLKKVRGIFLIACDGHDCYFREGVIWTEERFQGIRRPRLLKTLNRHKIWILEAPSTVKADDYIHKFMDHLKQNGGKKKSTVSIIARNKVNHLLAYTILLVPFLSFYPLTTQRMNFYSEKNAIAAITFKYRSSPVKESQAAYSKLEHMKALKNITVERSPIIMTVKVDGKVLINKKYDPRGLRKDSSIYVYEELYLKPGVHDIEIEITETANQNISKRFRTRKAIGKKDSIVITYNEKTGFFIIGKPRSTGKKI